MPGPRSPSSLLTFMGAVGLVVAYVATAPLAGRRDGDFIHFWVAGRLAGAQGALYDKAVQLSTLMDGFQGESLPAWGPQEDRLGLFLYPPHTAMLYMPLGFLPVRTAATVQALLAVGLGLAAAWLLHALLAMPDRTPPVAGLAGPVQATATPSLSALVLLVFLYPPFFYSFVVGQNAPLALVLMLAYAWLARRGKLGLAGLALGLLAFKPPWLLVLWWLPLALRQWRVLGGMLLGLAVLVLPTLLWLGTGPYQAYLASLQDVAALSDLPNYRLHLQYSGVGLLRRYLPPLWASGLGYGSALLILGASFSLLWRRWRQGMDLSTLALAVLAALWASPHLHHYDVLPSLTVAAVLLMRAHRGPSPWLAAGLLVLHHLAFVLVDLAHTSAWLPLPTLLLVPLWAWLARKALIGNLMPVMARQPPMAGP